MPNVAVLFLSVLLLGVTAQERVTPVEKVITLLTDLKAEVIKEGTDEAQVYDGFACFCKDTTASKSTAITTGRDNINSESATLGQKTAEKVEKETELDERKTKQEQLHTTLDDTKVRHAKEKAEYEATAADLTKAISSLNSAISSMMEGGGTQPGVLLEVRKSVESTLALADALNFIAEPKRKEVGTFLQTTAGVDPMDPTYKYHSQGIIKTLHELLTDFTGEKDTLDAEWTKTDKNYRDMIKSIEDQMTENKEAMDQLEMDIDTLNGDIATARENLVNDQAVLKDDELYMKDLTERCEIRAKDWDQRSAMRADEIQALTEALEVLQNKVQGRDEEVNKRALLQRAPKAAISAPAKQVSIAHHAGSASFVQEVATINEARALLRGSRAGVSTQLRQEKVVALLRKEGQRLSSPVLSTLATKVQADPFTKIKGLIQALVERLLKEAEAEATKKGFCDTELGKAEKDRDYRMQEAKDLNVDLKALEIKKAELEAEIELLDGEIVKLKEDLRQATDDRKAEHEENMDAISTAKEGLDAVKQAITILKVFYKKAGKATVLLQASPVDEDTTGAGFAGAYKAKQTQSKGIIGMLEVIHTDFDRTVRHTEAAEKKAQEEFVEFDRTSRADISGKETKKKLDEEDLETTDNTIAQKMADLQTAVGLLDDALKTIEGLKPMCIDTGMSYADRVAKREEEVAALRRALCILDTEDQEPDCSA